MGYSDLLDRMQDSDTEAFLEMTERYGWAVYSAIREKHSDQAVADRIYDETMNSFYNHLSRSTADDPLEALLCAFAESISPENISADRNLIQQYEGPPLIKLHHQEQPVQIPRKASGMKHFWMVLVMLLLLTVLLGLIWLTTGVMMAMDYIPFYDFGYSWFDANIFDFF